MELIGYIKLTVTNGTINPGWVNSGKIIDYTFVRWVGFWILHTQLCVIFKSD